MFSPAAARPTAFSLWWPGICSVLSPVLPCLWARICCSLVLGAEPTLLPVGCGAASVLHLLRGLAELFLEESQLHLANNQLLFSHSQSSLAVPV